MNEEMIIEEYKKQLREESQPLLEGRCEGCELNIEVDRQGDCVVLIASAQENGKTVFYKHMKIETLCG